MLLFWLLQNPVLPQQPKTKPSSTTRDVLSTLHFHSSISLQLLFHRKSTFTAHYLFLWRIKAFWVGKLAFSNFFTKDVRKGVVKKHRSGALPLSYSFSLGTFNCSLLIFFLTNAPAPESKNLPWNHPKTCFGGRRKASEAVEMSDGCYWGERANLLMKTMDDAKHCIADMQEVFGVRVAARSLF